jgi:hypothetical protein
MSVCCEMCKRASNSAYLRCERDRSFKKRLLPYCKHYLEYALERADLVVF